MQNHANDNRHVIMIIPNSGHNLKNRKGYHGQKFNTNISAIVRILQYTLFVPK